MNYFNRLTDRSGLSASPRSAVTPMARPAAAAISPGDHPEVGDLPEVGDVPQLPQTPASDAAATIAQPISGPPFAIGPATTPTPFEPMGTMPATASEIRRRTQEHIVEPSAPARPHQIERKAMPPAPPERVASVPATEPDSSLRDQPPIAPLREREIERETPSAAADQIVSDVSRSRIDAESGVSRSRMDAETASNWRALSPQVAAVEPAIHAAEYDIEVPPRAETQAATRQPAAGGERAVAHMSSRLRPAQPVPETEDIAVPALRMAPAAGRSREDRDTTARRHDRTATAAPRAHAGPGTRGASVEVRIGEVTLQVHAPPVPAALQAPPRHSFAPHRHYLRTW
jgi:hypothetical protein